MGGKCDINCGTSSSTNLLYSKDKDWLDGSPSGSFGFLTYEAWKSSKQNQKENKKTKNNTLNKKVNNSSSKTGRRSPLN